MNDDYIKIKDLVFSYGADNVLDGINLNIKKGEFIAIVGHNGSGKSTLAKMMNALLIPSSGSVEIDGLTACDDVSVLEVRKRVSMVFQNPDNQIVSSVVEDDIAFGPENLGMPPAEIEKRVSESIAAVGMSEYRQKAPHQLSGGQKQRIAIAGALAMGSDCIVFDEPTAMLDPKGRLEIMDIILDLHRQGKTIILITHFMEEAAKADRIAVLNKGRLAACESPAELFARDDVRSFGLQLPFAAELAMRLGIKGVVSGEDLKKILCESK